MIFYLISRCHQTHRIQTSSKMSNDDVKSITPIINLNITTVVSQTIKTDKGCTDEQKFILDNGLKPEGWYTKVQLRQMMDLFGVTIGKNRSVHDHYVVLKKYLENKSEKIPTKVEKNTSACSNILTYFNQQNIRTVGTHDDPWFVGKDVARVLGYMDTKDAISTHVKSENKISAGEKFDIVECSLEVQPQTILINQAGLYSLVLRSRLKSAEKFQDWVATELLPSLQKNGAYINTSEMQMSFTAITMKLIEQEKKNFQYKDQIEQLESEHQQSTNELVKLREEKIQIEELEKKSHEIHKELQKKITTLKRNIAKYQKRHRYVAIDSNCPCYYVYIVNNPKDGTLLKLRAGKAGTGEICGLDQRLRTHRGDDVNMILKLVIKSSDVLISMLEKNVEEVFKDFLVARNHEVYSFNTNVERFIEFAKTHITHLCLNDPTKYEFVSDEKLKEYNDDLQLTLNDE